MNCANHPERENTAFCQNCGKPVCQQCARAVGPATFCEPCLAARLAGAPPMGAYPGVPPPPPPSVGGSSPILAAILGFIPGVGAMYNAQFIKGIIHIIVFAVLISLGDHYDIFGLFIAGWIFYQVIEAYYTARARRDGLPLPNPFGLNDLGERLGFGKSWTSGGGPFAAPVGGPVPPPAGQPQGTPDYADHVKEWAQNFASDLREDIERESARSANPYAAAQPYAAPVPPYAAPAPPMPVYAGGRFPMGAIFLIVLGVFFLIGNTSFGLHAPVYRILPFFVIALGVWAFIHKMSLTGGMTDDGTSYYRMRLVNALHGSLWIVILGFILLLAAFHILSFGQSWPLWIIGAGLMVFLRRMEGSGAMAAPVPPPPAPAETVVPPSTPPEQQDKEAQ